MNDDSFFAQWTQWSRLHQLRGSRSTRAGCFPIRRTFCQRSWKCSAKDVPTEEISEGELAKSFPLLIFEPVSIVNIKIKNVLRDWMLQYYWFLLRFYETSLPSYPWIQLGRKVSLWEHVRNQLNGNSNFHFLWIAAGVLPGGLWVRIHVR